MNLHLYIDIHRTEFSDAVWRCTSAVLHNTDHTVVQDLLSKNGVTEQDVLDEIESISGVKIKEYRSDLNTDISGCSHFEQLVAMREELKEQKSDSPENKRIIRMLDDLVHMNDAMLFCLNPYEYDVWAPSLNNLTSN